MVSMDDEEYEKEFGAEIKEAKRLQEEEDRKKREEEEPSC